MGSVEEKLKLLNQLECLDISTGRNDLMTKNELIAENCPSRFYVPSKFLSKTRQSYPNVEILRQELSNCRKCLDYKCKRLVLEEKYLSALKEKKASRNISRARKTALDEEIKSLKSKLQKMKDINRVCHGDDEDMEKEEIVINENVERKEFATPQLAGKNVANTSEFSYEPYEEEWSNRQRPDYLPESLDEAMSYNYQENSFESFDEGMDYNALLKSQNSFEALDEGIDRNSLFSHQNSFEAFVESQSKIWPYNEDCTDTDKEEIGPEHWDFADTINMASHCSSNSQVDEVEYHYESHE